MRHYFQTPIFGEFFKLTLVIAAFWTDGSADACETGYQVLSQRLAHLADVRRKWDQENFTSPAEYDPEKPFLFLVTKLTTDDPLHVPRIKPGREDRFNLARTPERIHEVHFLSSSLISHLHRNTFRSESEVALILKVPSENIVATRPVDMQSSSSLRLARRESDDLLRIVLTKFSEKYPIIPPQDILSSTPRGVHNEVLLEGTSPSGKKLKVIGYALFQKNGRPPIPEETLDELTRLSREKNLPIIRIPWDGFENPEAEKVYINETERNLRYFSEGLTEPSVLQAPR